jgi:hypothetical protein
LFNDAVKNKNSTGSAVFGADEPLIVNVEKPVMPVKEYPFGQASKPICGNSAVLVVETPVLF